MREHELRALVDKVKDGTLPRRAFVNRMLMLGLTAPMASQMLDFYGIARAETKFGYEPTQRVGDTDDMNVQALNLGDYSANAFKGFVSPATRVANTFPNNAPIGAKTLRSNPGVFRVALRTVRVGRDAEITTYPFHGDVYLRLSNGRAWAFQHSRAGNGSINIKIIDGINPDASLLTYTPYNSVYLNNNCVGTIPGYSSTYAPGDVFTFGAVGFDIFLKFNGAEIVQFNGWRHMEPGCVAASSGFSEFSVNWPQQRRLYSNTNLKIYDIRDFGARDIPDVTGSIGGGSTTLTLSDEVDFRVGDRIIVAVGGEAGGGVRGEHGVGGSWPPLSYPSATSMNADTSKPNATWAQVEETGEVYAYHTTHGWVRNTSHNQQGYYTLLRVPIALVTNVVGVSGTLLTLADPAVAASTDAAVYLDCQPAFVPAFQTNDIPAQPGDIKIRLPAGKFAISEPVVVNGEARPAGLEIFGAGEDTEIIVPKGIVDNIFRISSLDRPLIHSMTLRGNHAPNGFGVKGASGAGVLPNGFIRITRAVHAAEWVATRDLVCIDPFGVTIVFSICENTWGENIRLFSNHNQLFYNGWALSVDSSRVECGYRDCHIEAVAIMKGYEPFNTLNSKFIRCSGVNAVVATNSAGAWLFEDLDLTFTGSCLPEGNPHGVSEALVFIGANAYRTSPSMAQGGQIIRPRIVQQGRARAKNTMRPLFIDSMCPNVTVEGDYPGAGPPTDKLGGYVAAPSWISGDANFGPIIISRGDNTKVRGMRVVGKGRASPFDQHHGNISLTGTGGEVRDCVADAIYSADAAQSGNQTNAEYEAK